MGVIVVVEQRMSKMWRARTWLGDDRRRLKKTRRIAIAVPSSNMEDKIEKREVCAVETAAVVKNEGENEAGNHSATAGTGAGTQCTNHRYGNLTATATRPTA